MLDDRGAGNTVTIAIGADTRPQTITVAGAGATSVAYKHNAFGERVSRVEGATTTHFHYDQDGRLIAESDGTGVVIREYLWLGDKPLGLVVGPAGSPTLYFVHADHLERVQKITDASQTIVWDGQFTPYGRTHAITGAVQNPLRFPGQWADPAAGYFYNYMRDYDPTLARYLSSDPIGTAGGRNSFTYAGANPQNIIDALGLEIIYEKGGVRFRAFPGPPAGGREHARMGPGGAYHVHLEDMAGRPGPRINVQSLPLQPLTPADEKLFTGKFRDVCRSITAQEQGYLNRATREIFHQGKLPENVERRRVQLQEMNRFPGRRIIPRPGGPP